MTMDHEEGHLTEEFVEDLMMILRRISGDWKPQLIDELPSTFCGMRIMLRNIYLAYWWNLIYILR